MVSAAAGPGCRRGRRAGRLAGGHGTGGHGSVPGPAPDPRAHDAVAPAAATAGASAADGAGRAAGPPAAYQGVLGPGDGGCAAVGGRGMDDPGHVGPAPRPERGRVLDVRPGGVRTVVGVLIGVRAVLGVGKRWPDIRRLAPLLDRFRVAETDRVPLGDDERDETPGSQGSLPLPQGSQRHQGRQEREGTQGGHPLRLRADLRAGERHESDRLGAFRAGRNPGVLSRNPRRRRAQAPARHCGGRQRDLLRTPLRRHRSVRGRREVDRAAGHRFRGRRPDGLAGAA